MWQMAIITNFAAMKRFLRHSFVMLTAFVAAMPLICCHRRETPVRDWATGCDSLNQKLDRLDDIRIAYDYDEDNERRELSAIDSLLRRKACVPGEAVGLFTQSLSARLDGNDSLSHDLSLRALTVLDSADFPYLHARIRMQAAITSADVPAKTESFYSLLPYFIARKDSMSVFGVLFELMDIYGMIWDDATQLEYFREAMNYVPDSFPNLKSIMQCNIIALQRAQRDTVGYTAQLERLRRDKKLMEVSPTLGVLVYCDLYRLHGHDADLDTAATYLVDPEDFHDTQIIYHSQKLLQSLKNNLPDSARIHAEVLEKTLYSDYPMTVEAMKGLLPYYKATSQKEKYAATDSMLSQALTRAEAYGEANRMAGIKARRHIDELHRVSDERERQRHHVMIWVGTAAGFFLLSVVAILLFMRRSKRYRESRESLEENLDRANRRLTVAQLRSAEKEKALENMLRDLDKISEGDSEVSANELKSHIKAVNHGQEEWNRFETVFTEMRPGFVEKLHKRYPDLTRGETRMCCLLAMDLDTKQIARLLAINPESVKKNRQRLRAKLQLPADTKWIDFFNDLR